LFGGGVAGRRAAPADHEEDRAGWLSTLMSLSRSASGCGCRPGSGTSGSRSRPATTTGACSGRWAPPSRPPWPTSWGVNELQVRGGLREGSKEPLDAEPASPAGDEVLVASTDMLAGPDAAP